MVIIKISGENMAENKRLAVKWIRDRAKKAYEKEDHCFICDTQLELELHHLCSLTLLLERWSKKYNHDITTDEGVLAIRDEFIEAHHDQIFNQVYTLCNKHHTALHKVYGKIPMEHTAPKQIRWMGIQKEKLLLKDSGVEEKKPGSFSNLYSGD